MRTVELNDDALSAPAIETGTSSSQMELMESTDAPTEPQLSENGESN